MENFNNHIEKPDKWGSNPELFFRNMHSTMVKHIKQVPGWKVVMQNMKEESQFKEALRKRNEPTLPSTLFLAPCELIMSRNNVDPLFSEFQQISEEIKPEYLPFKWSDVLLEVQNIC